MLEMFFYIQGVWGSYLCICLVFRIELELALLMVQVIIYIICYEMVKTNITI